MGMKPVNHDFEITVDPRDPSSYPTFDWVLRPQSKPWLRVAMPIFPPKQAQKNKNQNVS